ncbi:hypothetical protein AB2B38_011235 [Balneola sp. MJW-20]|uniref:hypothetical protein n=1 Tax=Gracilimonas aurantiaca TaxID=3234185 RepID=UPI0034679E39
MKKLILFTLFLGLAGCNLLGEDKEEQVYDIRIEILSAEGTHYINAVDYTTNSGTENLNDIVTPWVYTYRTDGSIDPSVEAFISYGDNATAENPLICRIYVDGEIQAEDRLTGGGSCLARYEFR